MGWPPGPGNMAARVRDKDWSTTPIGAIAQWPASLRIIYRPFTCAPGLVHVLARMRP
jgi:hypothetical protein